MQSATTMFITCDCSVHCWKMYCMLCEFLNVGHFLSIFLLSSLVQMKHQNFQNITNTCRTVWWFKAHLKIVVQISLSSRNTTVGVNYFTLVEINHWKSPSPTSIAQITLQNEKCWDNLGKTTTVEKGVCSSQQEECSFVVPNMMTAKTQTTWAEY